MLVLRATPPSSLAAINLDLVQANPKTRGIPKQTRKQLCFCKIANAFDYSTFEKRLYALLIKIAIGWTMYLQNGRLYDDVLALFILVDLCRQPMKHIPWTYAFDQRNVQTIGFDAKIPVDMHSFLFLVFGCLVDLKHRKQLRAVLLDRTHYILHVIMRRNRYTDANLWRAIISRTERVTNRATIDDDIQMTEITVFQNFVAKHKSMCSKPIGTASTISDERHGEFDDARHLFENHRLKSFKFLRRHREIQFVVYLNQ